MADKEPLLRGPESLTCTVLSLVAPCKPSYGYMREHVGVWACRFRQRDNALNVDENLST